MQNAKTFLVNFWNDESGISAVEYALLLAFVGGAIIVGATALASAVSGEMNETAQCIENSTGTSIDINCNS